MSGNSRSGAWTSGETWMRVAARVSVGAVVVVGAYIAIEFWGGLDNHLHGSLADWYGYTDATRNFLRTGEFYWPYQLAGPYPLATMGGQLYPPLILYLLVPFTVLPAFLWWAVPITVTAAVIIWLKPARWTWPLLAFAFIWPRTGAMIWFGNPGMWTVAALALGVRFAWPSTLVLVKPSLAPFALVGIRHRSWWIALGALVLLSLPILHLWTQYPTVLADARVTWAYSLNEFPPMCLPLFAAAGRDGRGPREAIAAVRSFVPAWHRRSASSPPESGREQVAGGRPS